MVETKDVNTISQEALWCESKGGKEEEEKEEKGKKKRERRREGGGRNRGAGRRHLKKEFKRGQKEDKNRKYHETNGKTEFQKKRVVKC